MRKLIYLVFVNSMFYGLVQSINEKNETTDTCAQVTRIIIAIKLDEECLEKSGTSLNFGSDHENSVEVADVEMSTYAYCLLKKSSIMNEEGEVNVNFDIIKIMKHLYKKTDERGWGLAFIIKSLEKCRSLSGIDRFVTATKIIKCLLDNQETIILCNRH